MFRQLLILTLLGGLALAAHPVGAQTAQVDPLTLRTRDVHQNLLIAADPYVGADRYKASFGKKSPYESGIIAIDVYFRNDNDSPIRLNLETIQLLVSPPDGDRQRLTPLSPEDVTDRMLLKAHANPTASRRPFPFPSSSGKSSNGKAWDETASLLRSLVLSTEVLPPHATTHGFLFFDMNHQFDAIHTSRLYIPDLFYMTEKRPLFFFEVDLGTPGN